MKESPSYTPEKIESLNPNQIFVFGSNMEGYHTDGAAAQAMEWGAKWGCGEGLQGQTYAIPTMFATVEEIKPYVERFIDFARLNPAKLFLVIKIGCGIAGFDIDQIAPLFEVVITNGIKNILLPKEFVINIITNLVDA